MRTPSKRLGHKKSRTGCLRCKTRHVKCDELRPCTNCVRFDVTCSLTLPPDSVQSHVEPNRKTASKRTPIPRVSSSTPPSQLQAQAPITPQESVTLPIKSPATISDASPSAPSNWNHDQSYLSFPVTWMQSLRLVHHYSTVVCEMMSQDSCTNEIWKITVPQTAFSHEFLMHGLLAVSALHYAQTHPDERDEYLIISSHYQSLALQFFTTRLGDISDENFEPFFFLATFIFLWNLCSFSDPHDSAKPVSTAEISQSFQLLHGIKSICDAKPSGWSEDGPLVPLFQQWEPVTVDRTGSFQAQLDRLYELARDLSPSFDAINTQSSCLLAIETLRTTYAACMSDKSTKMAQRIWFWPITLTQFFIELIRTNHPVALIILAHYAALARTFEKKNLINVGWSPKVMDAVKASLEDKWLDWVAWPSKSLRDGIDVDKMNPP